LFARAGFRDIDVRPVGGTKLALATLWLAAIERAGRSRLASSVARALVVAPANVLCAWLLLDRAEGRRSVPGELAINYLVVART
jgi:hypothetical protein